MKIPPKLLKGDNIAIVATARSTDKSDLQDAIKIAESWGLNVYLGNSIGKISHQFAGTDTERATDLQAQINNPNIKAIWCAKGGYGSIRILDEIDFLPLQKQPKWIIGYSDITVFHAHLQNLGLVSLHAQMPVDISTRSAESAATIRSVLFGESQEYNFEHHPLNALGEITAPVVGGNLSVLFSLCGSASFPQQKKVILLLEDLDEYVYHLDRMAQNFKRIGLFANLAGVIVGGMTEMKDNEIPFGLTAEEIIHGYLKDLNIPVVFGAPFGHQYKNLAIPMGKSISLKLTKEKSSIQF
jgi:muramoyltetrapeptide carboxypeptidase